MTRTGGDTVSGSQDKPETTFSFLDGDLSMPYLTDQNKVLKILIRKKTFESCLQFKPFKNNE